ncbi:MULTISPECIES: hypothetical protein [unclassified Streptomyces]|uniref:hypothetical protein n=1 Tax=unclassified Streptomyces TaxID=2593676 RepID=UPI0011A9539A|nr:hypothetical protein [Streptomyces sp. CNQ-509]
MTTDESSEAKKGRRPVAHAVMQILIGAFCTVIGAWALLPMMVDRVELTERNESVVGILYEDPLHCLDGCQVRYEIDNQEVTGRLPVNANLKMREKGDSLDLIYDPDEPRRAALKKDLNIVAIALRALLPLLVS